jgi:hypothetical protein
MTNNVIVNLPASIHQRLLNLDPGRLHDFTPVLRRYALERWLYRLGESDQAERFVLKGAMMFVLWTRDMPRKTMDLDLLRIGHLTDAGFRRACAKINQMNVRPDGMTFDTEAIIIEPIRNDAEFQGLRARFMAHLGNIRVPIQVDVGIGDEVWPEPEYIDYPTLLDMPAPRIKAYKKEASIAEKLDAMLSLGKSNSRMKDFYDVAVLADRFAFNGTELQKAVERALKKSVRAALSELPSAFSDQFATDNKKNVQWRAFLRRIGKRHEDLPFPQIISKISTFLLPVIQLILSGREFRDVWEPGGPWRPREKDNDG